MGTLNFLAGYLSIFVGPIFRYEPVWLALLILVIVALVAGRRSTRWWCVVGSAVFTAAIVALVLYPPHLAVTLGSPPRYDKFACVVATLVIAGSILGALWTQRRYPNANRTTSAGGVLLGGLVMAAAGMFMMLMLACLTGDGCL